VDEEIRTQLMLLKRDSDFWASLGIVSAKFEKKAPRLVIGPLATGSSVLADARVAERIRSTQHRGLVGLDMEVYGAYASARACGTKTKFLALKSVCDMGDMKKDNKFQPYAAQIAAMVVAHFLKKFSAPLFASI
jgi:nucleoside phosphorylase